MMPQTMHILALAGALCSAAATIFIRRGLRGGDPYTGFWINVVVGTTSLWTAVIVTGGPGHVSIRGALLCGLAGLIGTVGGRLLRFVAIEKVGASISATLINLNPLVASALATPLCGTAPIFVLFLAPFFLRDVETLRVRVVAGTVLIVLGVYLITALTGR